MADTDDQTDAAGPLSQSDAGRIVVIDILRGLAILWVMTFHLWTDQTGGVAGVSALYARLGDRIRDGNPLHALTALGELVLGSGYQGVAVFMMLSGISLTLNAHRRGDTPILRGYATRFRKVIVPYWAGILFVVATFALVAALQAWRDGGGFETQWDNVRIGVVVPVHVHVPDIFWALTVFGPIVRDKYATPPIGSLWFVPVLLQYYLIFPFALRLLRRTGPWLFAALAIAVTVAARTLFVQIAPDYLSALHVARTLELVAIFRGSEFLLGMSIGYLFARQRDQTREWAAPAFDALALVAFGAFLQWASVSITPDADVLGAAQVAASQVALALFMLPLLFKTPGRLETSAAARALVFLGVISFTALIVDDAMRYVASFLRSEGVSGPVWWIFLVAVYIPGATVVIAYPMAWLLGLLPRAGSRATSQPAEPRSVRAGAIGEA